MKGRPEQAEVEAPIVSFDTRLVSLRHEHLTEWLFAVAWDSMGGG